MIKAYNKCVKKAVKKVYYKFGFTVAGIALTGAVLSNPWIAAGAVLKMVQFATLERKPVIDAGANEAAAMFHDVQTAFGSPFD